MNTGILYAALSFAIWGLFPLYFHAIREVAPLEMLAHRMLWSLLFLSLVLSARRQWAWLLDVLKKPRVVASFIASAFLLSANWFTYIRAVNQGHVIDASFGYFITPLVNVMLGFILLDERLRRVQWLAIALAACGVAWLAWQTGQMPWISLVLALTFGSYGLMRKTAALGALEGLSFETLILLPAALAYLAWLMLHGESSFITSASNSTRALLLASGPITAIPLLLFATGARRIPLSMLGLLQYITPSIQLLIGIWIFGEAFTQQRLLGFVIIWSAIVLYAVEGIWHANAGKKIDI